MFAVLFLSATLFQNHLVFSTSCIEKLADLFVKYNLSRRCRFTNGAYQKIDRLRPGGRARGGIYVDSFPYIEWMANDEEVSSWLLGDFKGFCEQQNFHLWSKLIKFRIMCLQ